MQTKVIYLSGNMSDEEKLNGLADQGYKLQSTQLYQGQIVGYMVREPWATTEKPLEARNVNESVAVPVGKFIANASDNTTPEVRPTNRLGDQRGKHNRR